MSERTIAQQSVEHATTTTTAGVLQRACACGQHTGGGECEHCRKQRESLLQRSAVAATESGVPSIVNEVLHSSGQPLDGATRLMMERGFGHDFSGVRVHTDDQAARSAQSVNALAYTVGQHIAFGSRQYQPYTRAGQRLLAHELTHTIQQRGQPAVPQAKLRVGAVSDPAEAAADRAAHAVLNGGTLPSLDPVAPAIQRYAITRVENVNENEKLVHLDDQTRYRIRRVRWLSTTTERVGFTRLAPGIDRQRLWLDLEWCAGQNSGQIRVGANVPQQVLQTIVRTVRSGGDVNSVIRDLDVTPFAELTVLQSGSWRVTAGSEVTVDVQGRVTGVQGRVGVSVGPLDVDVTGGSQRVGDDPLGGGQITGRVTVTPGRRTQQRDCRRERVRIVENTRYECQRERDAPPREVPDPSSRFIYFDYARDTIDRSRSAAEIRGLRDDLANGYQVIGVRGFTSPEGPQARGRRFVGNEELARQRARAAAQLAQAECPPDPAGNRDSCIVGEGELYTLSAIDARGEQREVEGAPLAEHATEEFLTQEEEARHRTPELVERINRAGSPQEQADLVYPLLRRAEIRLVRNRTEQYTEQVPGGVRSEYEQCPEDVIERAFPPINEALRGR